MIDKANMNSIECELIEGMEGLLEDLKSDAPLSEKYTCHKVVLDLEPTPYTSEQVKATRKLLSVSQVLFAQFLGVSPKTVRSWERGKTPSEIACRFMDEIRRDPDHWRRRLKESLQVKAC